MSKEDTIVSFSLEVNVEKAYQTTRRLLTVFFRFLALLRRMGLPEELDAAILKMQRFIALLNQARLAAIALQTASGPIGWALAGIGLAGTLLTAGDFLMEFESH